MVRGIGEIMKLVELEKLFISEKTDILEFVGKCHDCGKDVLVEILNTPEGITIIGGAVYRNEVGDFLKCDACHSIDPILRNYQPCQNYTRTVGYLRPVDAMNDAKQQEVKMRKMFKVPEMV